jgi:hypothetical protein
MLKDKSKTKGDKSIAKLSYKDSYTDAVASKWESKGGYDAYLKAAKSYNQKKYGTTEPTATADKAGISKEALANKNTKDVNKTKVKGTMRGSVDDKKKDDSLKLKSLKKEVKPIKVKTKQDVAKEKIASGDKKAGKSAGLEGKAKRKANKAGKAQMKAGDVKSKLDDALKQVSEKQKKGESVEVAQAETKRLNKKFKRKKDKADKKRDKAENSMATYKDAAYMKDDAAYMKTNQDGGVMDPAAAADQLKGLSAGVMRENPIGYFKQSIKYNVKEASNPSLSASARKHYAENAQHDMKSMAPMHGSMKGDQSASRVDYANYKGTDKGYHGKTGSSHGDQSASKADYMGKKKGGSILSKHFKS